MYHASCFSATTTTTTTTTTTENSTPASGEEDSHNVTLILSTVIPSLITVITVAILAMLVQKGIICNKEKSNENIIVHKNDLYGNLTNQDYFDERYDTKITDENQYYEEEYEESKL